MRSVISTLVFFFGLGVSAVNSQSQPDAKITNEQYKDWTYNCLMSSAEEQCEIVTKILSSDGGTFAQLSFQINKDELDPLFQIAVPTLIDLKKPVDLKVDNSPLVELGYSFCNPQACFVAERASIELINALKGGNELVMQLRSVVNGDITAKVSLLGFTDAFARLVGQAQ